MDADKERGDGVFLLTASCLPEHAREDDEAQPISPFVCLCLPPRLPLCIQIRQVQDCPSVCVFVCDCGVCVLTSSPLSGIYSISRPLTLHLMCNHCSTPPGKISNEHFSHSASYILIAVFFS